jgi:hypothetical protein
MLAVGEFSRVGIGIWHWFREIGLDDHRDRNLWLGLYTSGPAKRICTGLWHGEITTMAGSASMRVDDAYSALDELIRKGLVEFDRRLSVLRFTQLPDAGERPGSWKALKGMWNGFITVPKCAVRDRHVQLMRWLVEHGSISPEMETTWRQTFGTITVPSDVPSPSLLSDSDTGTRVQPGLFAKQTIIQSSGMTFDSVSIDQGSGRDPDQDQDLDRDQDPDAKRPGGRTGLLLQLVPKSEPQVEPLVDIGKAQRAAHAKEMQEVVRSCGGGHLLGDPS